MTTTPHYLGCWREHHGCAIDIVTAVLRVTKRICRLGHPYNRDDEFCRVCRRKADRERKQRVKPDGRQ